MPRQVRDDDVAARVSEALAEAGFRTLTRSPERLEVEVESHHGTVSISLPTADVQRFLARSAADASAVFPDVPAHEGAIRLLFNQLWENLAADGPPVVSLTVGAGGVEVEVARLPAADEDAAAARPRGSWRARPHPPGGS